MKSARNKDSACFHSCQSAKSTDFRSAPNFKLSFSKIMLCKFESFYTANFKQISLYFNKHNRYFIITLVQILVKSTAGFESEVWTEKERLERAGKRVSNTMKEAEKTKSKSHRILTCSGNIHGKQKCPVLIETHQAENLILTQNLIGSWYYILQQFTRKWSLKINHNRPTPYLSE